jgi:hypothetical protein
MGFAPSKTEAARLAAALLDQFGARWFALAPPRQRIK